MTPRRLLLTLPALIALVAAVPSYAHESGGVPALPLIQEPGGGVVAPVDATDEEADSPAPPPVMDSGAEPAQDDTPTTPGGEEQPPDEEPPPDDDDEPGEENGGPMGPVDDLPGDAAGGVASGPLPHTGLRLAALSAIGLGLLMAGLALRPTASWPPPRARLTRSTRRR